MDSTVTFVAIVLVLGAILLGSYLYEKQRTEMLKGVSKQIGLPFYPKGNPSLIDELSQFHLFSQGNSKEITNLFHGQAQQAEVAMFGYHYRIGIGKNSQTHSQTVIYFRSSSLNLPRFALRPEKLFHKIGQVFGYQDVDFDSHPMFSQYYLLRADDVERVRCVFSDHVLAYFEQKRGVGTEGGGDQLIFYRSEKRIHPYQMRFFLEEGFRVLELFKQ